MAEGPQAYSSQFWVSHYQCPQQMPQEPQQMLSLHLQNREVTGPQSHMLAHVLNQALLIIVAMQLESQAGDCLLL